MKAGKLISEKYPVNKASVVRTAPIAGKSAPPPDMIEISSKWFSMKVIISYYIPKIDHFSQKALEKNAPPVNDPAKRLAFFVAALEAWATEVKHPHTDKSHFIFAELEKLVGGTGKQQRDLADLAFTFAANMAFSKYLFRDIYESNQVILDTYKDKWTSLILLGLINTQKLKEPKNKGYMLRFSQLIIDTIQSDHEWSNVEAALFAAENAEDALHPEMKKSIKYAADQLMELKKFHKLIYPDNLGVALQRVSKAFSKKRV